MRIAKIVAASAAALLTMPQGVRAMTTISYFSEAITVATNERHVGGINDPADVARALNACWRPPHAGDEITIRLSFRRDGSVFGQPRIVFHRTAAGGPDADARLATSITEAVARCAPLPFTRQLGAGIAGQVFLIHLIAP